MPASRLIRAALRGFDPYAPGQQPPDAEGWVKLNTNESPWPPSPRVLRAVREAVDDSLRLYPNPTAQSARDAIAAFHGLDAGWVAMGNGGDELIELCFRAFAGARSAVAFPRPTYPLLEPLCAIHEARPVRYPLLEGWEIPDEFSRDPAALKFLVNPNSPTGSWSDRAHVEAVVERSPGVVVLDEAYVDFAPEDRLDLLRQGPENLIVLRTFSKSYALAGMRIGYALGHPDLIAALDMVKDSYNLDRLAIVAAAAAIRDREHHDALVRFVVEERGRLAVELERRGLEVLPSAANFLFCRPPAALDATAVFEGLRQRRVLVRHYTREPIAGWFRVTIGTCEQHLTLLRALDEVMA